MTISNAAPLLDTAADTIREQQKLVEKLQGDTLLANKLIGDALVSAKEFLEKTGTKGDFGKWCEEQGFNYGRQWRSLLMSLSVNWKAIQKEMAKTGPVKSVEKAVALVKAQPIKREEQDKLLALLEQAEGGDETAQAKLEREAKKHKMDSDAFQEKLDKLKAKRETPKEKPEDTIAKLAAQIERLTTLLAAAGIDPEKAPEGTAGE